MINANNSVSTNSTSNPSTSSPESIASFVFLSIIIIVGIVGNSLVVTIVTMINSMKTTTNLLLLNVAIADIVTLVLTAIHVILPRSVTINGRTGSFMCKVISPNTLSNVALLATVLTLTVLSVERYNALVKPMRLSRRLSTDNVVYVILGIWFVSMVMALPMLVYLDYDPVIKECSAGGNLNNIQVSVGCIAATMTIIPFLVIAFSYSQIISGLYFSNTICNSANPSLSREDLIAKRKLVKLLVIVTVIFFVAFVPYGVLNILKFSLHGRISKQQLENIRNLALLMVYLVPLHSSINPLLYTWQSQNYREGFMIIVSKMLCKPGQGWNMRGAASREPLPSVNFRQEQVNLSQGI